MAAIFLALGHALPQRLPADHTVTETATGTWEWVAKSGGSDMAVWRDDTIWRDKDPADYNPPNNLWGPTADPTYTLTLKETPPDGGGWVRVGDAPPTPEIQVTIKYRVEAQIVYTGLKPTAEIRAFWSGPFPQLFKTGTWTTWENSDQFAVEGPSYSGEGKISVSLVEELPWYLRTQISYWKMDASWTFEFEPLGPTTGSSTYTRQVPGSHSSVPEPREWAMMAGLPLAAFACARRLRPHRRQR